MLASWTSLSSFVRDYATAGFSVRGCAFLDGVPSGTIVMPAEFSHSVLNPLGIVELPYGVRQIILRGGMIWGNTPPDRLHDDLSFYGLDPTIPRQRVVDTYRDAAFRTQPAPRLEAAQPAALAGRIGVHIRLGDKLVAQETSHDMSEATKLCRPTSPANTAASVHEPDRQVETPAARRSVSASKPTVRPRDRTSLKQLRVNC